jgi:hypothetical protein
MLTKIKQDNMNKYKTPANMGMVSQNTQIPSTHPITGELMYNNAPMPNRAGVPNRSVNDMTAIDSSYPMDPNKIPASQGTMTAKFGSIAKYMDDPIKKTGSPALNYAQPRLVLDESMSMGNEIAEDLSKKGKMQGAMEKGDMNEEELDAYLKTL